MRLLEVFIEKMIRNTLPISYGERVKAIPEFQEWFGNSAVKTKNNIPIMVLHATTREFISFDKKHSDENTGINTNYLGFYFTTAPKTAEIYVSKQFNASKGIKTNGSFKMFFLKIQKPLFISEDRYWRLSKLSKTEIESYVSHLKSKGHDGIIMPSVWRGASEGTDFVVFDNSQIKSVFNKTWNHPTNFSESVDINA